MSDDELAANDEKFATETTGEPQFGLVCVQGTYGHYCAKCKVLEEAGGDNSYDGASTVSVLSDNLRRCSIEGCECAIHAGCAKTIEDKSGLCPHCAWLENEKRHARLEAETLLEQNVAQLQADVALVRERIAKESDPAALQALHDKVRLIAIEAAKLPGDLYTALNRHLSERLPLQDVA